MATAKTVKDVSPHEFVKAHLKPSGKSSGAVARHILQQLLKINIVVADNKTRGRKITASGQRVWIKLLDESL